MKRILAPLLLILLAAIAAQAQEARVNWTGDWRSFWRDGQALMTLEQLGDRVVGGYTPGDGRIEATVSGDLLVGEWIEQDARGAFTFAMSRDGASFSGRFGNGEYWNGKRLDENRASPTPFTRSDTPREALRTVITAANATADGQADAALVWGPLLTYADYEMETSRTLFQRRALFLRLMDMMAFRLNDAPNRGEAGEARFKVGPAGSDWRTEIVLVETQPEHWRLVVPPLAEIERDIAATLEALGFDSFGA